MPREIKLLEEILLFMDMFVVERGAQQQGCTFLIPAAFPNLILKLRLSAVRKRPVTSFRKGDEVTGE